MKFAYKAVNSEGEVVHGTSEAKDKYDLNHILTGQNLTLLSAEEEGSNKMEKFWKQFTSIGGVSTHEKIIFARNLSAMIDAGLSISRALAVMARQTKNKKLASVLEGVNVDIKSGSTLHHALGKFPKVFSPLFVSMVAAGEESGNLAQSLSVVGEQMDKTYTLKKKVRGALIYPGVIITAMLGIGTFMLIFIVPTLTKTFDELGVDLPASTRFIISVSDMFQNNAFTMLVVLVLLIIAFIISLRTDRGRKYLAFVILRIPIIAPLVKETNTARTARTLSSLVSSGVPYVRALEITKEVLQNVYYKRIVEKAEKQIQLGLPVSSVFIEAEKLYPVFMGEMIAVGEETGELAPMLIKVATYFENEVELKTKNMSTIIEPFLMIVVGAAVGFFALSMITPMYSLVETI